MLTNVIYIINHHIFIFYPFISSKGSLCQYYYCPEDFCVKLPDNFPSLEEAALIEPLSVGVHACKLADLKVGQTVMIFGAGTVGLLAGAVAKASGAIKITMVDINQSRLNFAKDY